MSRRATNPGVVALAVCVALVALGCSLFQGASYLARFSVTDEQRYLFVAVAGAIIIGSPVISRLVGSMLAVGVSGGIITLAVLVIVAAETFSVGTSASALRAGLLDAERSENLGSPEYQSAQRIAMMYLRQAEELQRRGEQLPAGYATRSAGMQDTAARALERARQAQRQAAAVNVSTTGRALAAIESRTGLGPEHLTMTGAVLLSAIPLVIFMSLGALSASTTPAARREGGSGKPRAQG